MNNDIEDKFKKKTLSIMLNNNQNFIFKFLSVISKNTYNTTIYISSIYIKYKDEIYRYAFTEYLKHKSSNKKDFFYEKIYEKFEYFYNLHSSENSVIQKNNNFLYSKIIEKLKSENLNNQNFHKIKNQIMLENLDKIKFSNEFEFEFIIEQILISMYRKKYNLTSYEMLNKIPVTHEDFIEIVKSNTNMFPLKKSIKDSMKFLIDSGGKLLSDENIITRFIYKHLGDNKDKIPSDLICNIIKKAFQNFNSFWSLKEKGLKCSMSKFLQKDELFILPFFMRSFKINNDNSTIRLTVGKYIANNLIDITKNKNLICLNEENNTEYKKYIDKKYLIGIPDKINLSKKNNFIIGDKYVAKNNENIIDGYYVNLKLPKKIINKKIKLIEINSLYKGFKFKLNITYDTDEKITEITKNKLEKKLNLNSEDALSIDFGMKNLMTIYDPSGIQTIIKGNYLLSLNHYYNKQIDICNSELSKEYNEEMLNLKYNLELKRQNKINDYFNKIVKYLFLMYDSKKVIIAGYNLNWKKNLNLGRNNNRKFYGIPYRKLIEKLKDKFGEKFILTEESYTSKCDALNLEEVKKQEKYSGERIKRGLFKSPKGLINADLNGAINIMRKKITLTEITGMNIKNPLVIKIRKPQLLNISRDVVPTVKLINLNQRVKSKMVPQKVTI